MKNKRILVGVNNDLVTDARVHKVCTSLQEAGYEICLIGLRRRNSAELERNYTIRRFPMWFKGGPLLYAEFNTRLLCTLLFSKGDAILCNDTDAVLACFFASKIRRIPLIFDAHELFPELPEVVNRPFIRKVWQKVEDWVFPHLKHCYTVCQSIADYYHRRYGLRMAVVRNIPSREPEDVQIKPVELGRKEKYMLLYQGAVNVGRGIEWLIETMQHLEECCLVICGEGDCLSEMKELALACGAGERILFTGRIPQEELKKYTVQAHLGFVLLEKLGLSYYYALPNRIFDYMRFGVPVLATSFPEITRIVEEAQSGRLITHYEPTYLAREIRSVLREWESDEKKEQLKKRAQQYSWENEEKVLLHVIEQTFAHQPLH